MVNPHDGCTHDGGLTVTATVLLIPVIESLAVIIAVPAEIPVTTQLTPPLVVVATDVLLLDQSSTGQVMELLNWSTHEVVSVHVLPIFIGDVQPDIVIATKNGFSTITAHTPVEGLVHGIGDEQLSVTITDTLKVPDPLNVKGENEYVPPCPDGLVKICEPFISNAYV